MAGNAIEGHRFAALTNLASNLKGFLCMAAEQPEVEALSRALANDPALISEVFQRARTLLAIPADEEREAEGDAALATYLWFLNCHRPDLAQTAADGFRERGPFFWARKLADDLRTTNGSANGNGAGADGETAAGAAEDRAAVQRKAWL
jgi:hypothetical protein